MIHRHIRSDNDTVYPISIGRHTRFKLSLESAKTVGLQSLAALIERAVYVAPVVTDRHVFVELSLVQILFQSRLRVAESLCFCLGGRKGIDFARSKILVFSCVLDRIRANVVDWANSLQSMTRRVALRNCK